MEWSSQKRRNACPRWHLPENCASVWMQQVCSQQRVLAAARQKNLWRSPERCLREALTKLGDKSTQPRPRQLTPLTVKPPATTVQYKEHSIHQLQQSEIKLTIENSRYRGGAIANSATKSPLLSIPIHPVVSTNSSSGSSSASSPLPDTLHSAATLSAQPKFSVFSACTADQSPFTQRKGRLSPLKLASQGSKIKQAPSLFLPQRTPPKNITFCGRQNPPFISPVSPINPKPRPAIPTIRARNLSPYGIRQKPKRQKKSMAAQPSTAVAESKVKAANADQALSLAPTAANRGAPHGVSTATQDVDRSHNRLTIPEITIRFATPTPTENNHCTFVVPVIAIRAATPVPGEEEESQANLCDHFVFRAELAQELGVLKNDLQHLSGAAASERH